MRGDDPCLCPPHRRGHGPEGDPVPGYRSGVPDRGRGHPLQRQSGRGEDLLFRGAFYEPDGGRTLLFEDGSTAGFFNSSNSDNVYYDFTQEPNSEEPSAAILVELWAGPVLTHRGHWSFWVMGTVFSALLALWILYAEKLVRQQLAYVVREPEKAEPSEWMLTRQRIGWVLWTILDFVIYSWGLK